MSHAEGNVTHFQTQLGVASKSVACMYTAIPVIDYTQYTQKIRLRIERYSEGLEV